MCARKSGDSTWPATSRRLRSFQAGSTLRKMAGAWAFASYQPTPKPSPLVVSTPRRAWRLWSMREWSGIDDELAEVVTHVNHSGLGQCSPFRSGSRLAPLAACSSVLDPEDLLLLGLELLVAEDALLPQLGEPLKLAHVLRFGRSGRRSGRSRLLAASEVLLHPYPVLDERATPLHARHGPVGLPRLHTACGSCCNKSHLFSPSSSLVRLA